MSQPGKKILKYVLILLLFTPLWMYLFWLVSPKKTIRVSIVDKTVLTTQGTEHESFNWVLKYNRYCKPDKSFYSIATDYYGFFPKGHEKFEVHGLEAMDTLQIKALVENTDMAYYTDTYGIYHNEWYRNSEQNEKSKLIYGGLTANDLYYLGELKKRKKLILAEFNTIASPTTREIRTQFEELFKLRWSGWVGRYFVNLDTVKNQDLPKWLVRNYKAQHGGKWTFQGSGIVFVREDDHIEIVDGQKDLKNDLPYIHTSKENCKRFGLPEQIKYPYWFDIMSTSHTNAVISEYVIETNKRGDSILEQYSILNRFPAVIEHNQADYKFYYFSGDFADNPISQHTAYFKGIPFFSSLFYDGKDPAERSSFFWNYYIPLVSTILDQEMKNKH